MQLKLTVLMKISKILRHFGIFPVDYDGAFQLFFAKIKEIDIKL